MQRAFLLLVLALLGACANSPAPRYDAKFGDAVRQSRQLMVLTPDAGTNQGTVTGLDGIAAAEAIGRYHESLKAPPPVVNVINIGGPSGGR